MQYIEELKGRIVNDPIRNSLTGGAALRAIWDNWQKSRIKNNMQAVGDLGHWRYTMLKYCPGLVTYCGINNAPVITGWMSGCFLFRFRYHGNLYAAHVGTDDSDTDKNDKVKEVWQRLAAKDSVSDILGYNPAREVSMESISAVQRSGGLPKIAGYWERNGSMRIVTFGAPQHDRHDLTKLQVFGVDTAPLQSWDVLRNDPKFT